MCPVQGTGRIGSPFVEAMMKGASEKDLQVWQAILHSVLSSLYEVSFTEPVTVLESKLFALDVFLRSPMLQRLLVSRSSVPVSPHLCKPEALPGCRMTGAHLLLCPWLGSEHSKFIKCFAS